MSFIRSAWALRYFKDRSQEYVFSTSHMKSKKMFDSIEDYGSKYEHKPSLIELIANFILSCTGDEKYTWKMVKILAKDYGIEGELRKKPATWKWIVREMDRFCKKEDIRNGNHDKRKQSIRKCCS